MCKARWLHSNPASHEQACQHICQESTNWPMARNDVFLKQSNQVAKHTSSSTADENPKYSLNVHGFSAFDGTHFFISLKNAIAIAAPIIQPMIISVG